MAYVNTFMRHEIKFLLTEQQRDRVMERISGMMTEDAYSRQTISSIYCDNCDILIRTSLDKPIYREKIRLRAYGVPKDDSTVFLEIKKKFRGTVYKRRAEMTYLQAYTYICGGEVPQMTEYNGRQVMSEIDYTTKRLSLRPAAAIFYDRRAFHGNQDGEIRLTLDNNVRYRLEQTDLRLGTSGRLLTGQPDCVMEIKSAGAVPLWLSAALTEIGLTPGSFSKYGSVYKEKSSGLTETQYNIRSEFNV